MFRIDAGKLQVFWFRREGLGHMLQAALSCQTKPQHLFLSAVQCVYQSAFVYDAPLDAWWTTQLSVPLNEYLHQGFVTTVHWYSQVVLFVVSGQHGKEVKLTTLGTNEKPLVKVDYIRTVSDSSFCLNSAGFSKVYVHTLTYNWQWGSLKRKVILSLPFVILTTFFHCVKKKMWNNGDWWV